LIRAEAKEVRDAVNHFKIPLMAEGFRQMEAGKFALTDRIKLTDGAGVNLEDAIGRIAEVTANYFAARP
jgi:hypothetical protein